MPANFTFDLESLDIGDKLSGAIEAAIHGICKDIASDSNQSGRKQKFIKQWDAIQHFWNVFEHLKNGNTNVPPNPIHVRDEITRDGTFRIMTMHGVTFVFALDGE